MPLTSVPNLLTLSRILVIPVVVATFYVDGDYARWFGCALFSAAGVTDWLDGHVARRWEQQSELGRFLDPIADKLLVSATLFMLTVMGRLPSHAVLPALVILCREILVSGLREYLAGLRVGVPVSRLAKWKTAIQMVAIGFLIVGEAGWRFIPVVAIGETLLWLAALIPELTARGVTVSTIKHAHHEFDIDQPGKDSWRHRQAGAREVMVASSRRFALMHELRDEPEPSLAELAARMAPVDLLLVEGFKREPHPKLEVHRPSVGKPFLYPDDPHIVAIASDRPLTVPLTVLPLADVAAIADFIIGGTGSGAWRS